MDLAVGAKNVYVMTDHCTRDGQPKLLDACTYPLTGQRVVNRVYTDVAVIDITDKGFMVLEKLAAISPDQLSEMTGAELAITDTCGELRVPPI